MSLHTPSPRNVFGTNRIYQAIKDDDVSYVLDNYHRNEKTLNWCIELNKYILAKELLKDGIDVNYGGIDGHQELPLVTAIYRRSIDIVQLLLEYGADPNFVDDYWQYPLEQLYMFLDYAISESLRRPNHPLLQILQVLFKYGADPNITRFPVPDDDDLPIRPIVEKEYFKFLKAKWLPVGIAFKHLTAHELMCIMEEICPTCIFVPIHKRWELVTTIKHF